MKTLLFLFLPILSFSQTNSKTACEQKVKVMQEEIYKLSAQLEDYENCTRMNFQKTIEIETMKRIMRGYIVQIDSLQTLRHELNTSKNNEIELLQKELIKSIKAQEPISMPDRIRLTDFSLDYGELPKGIVISLKLWINDAGKVVMIKVISDHSKLEDHKFIDHVVAQIKKQVRYNVLENSPLQAVFFKIELE